MKTKTIIHLVLALLVLGFTAATAQAATKESTLTDSLQKLEKAGIIDAEARAHFAKNAFKGKKCDAQKMQALVIAFAKYSGAPSGSYTEAIKLCYDKEIVTSENWKKGKTTDGKALSTLIIRIAREVK